MKLSYEAYIADVQYNSRSKQRQLDQLYGMIVTESGSDDPDAVLKADSILDDSLKDVVIKKCIHQKTNTSKEG